MSAWDWVLILASIICLIDVVQGIRRRIRARRSYREYNDRIAEVHGLRRKTGESDRELRARITSWSRVSHRGPTKDHLIAVAMNVDQVKRVELGEAAGVIHLTVWPGDRAYAALEAVLVAAPCGVSVDVRAGD